MQTYMVIFTVRTYNNTPRLQGFILLAEGAEAAILSGLNQLPSYLAKGAVVTECRPTLPGDEMYVYSNFGGESIVNGYPCEIDE